MKKPVFLVVYAAVALVLLAYAYGARLPERTKLEQMANQVAAVLTQAAIEVSAPPPIRATRESPTALLTRSGVRTWTNTMRRENGGLTPLAINDKLNAAAEAKLKDLFAKQYFEHVSPTGVGPAILADRVGYRYIAIGENLALGDFANDQELVQAWMDSPGHRANILGKGYSEIGIAVGRGLYEGKTTWIAVQEFGRPLSACAQPDASLKAKADADEARVAQLKTDADHLLAELDATPEPRTKKQVNEYNAKVDEYNALVARINALVRQTQGEITVYNGQVQAFNTCVQG